MPVKARITIYAPGPYEELTEEQYDKISSVVAAWVGMTLDHPVGVRILSSSGSAFYGNKDKVFLYDHGLVHVETEQGRRGRGMVIDPFAYPHHYGHSCHPSCRCRGRSQAPMWTVREGLMLTLKGRGQSHPGIEWWPGSQPTVQELKEFLDTQDPDDKIRIGTDGVTKFICVQEIGRP